MAQPDRVHRNVADPRLRRRKGSGPMSLARGGRLKVRLETRSSEADPQVARRPRQASSRAGPCPPPVSLGAAFHCRQRAPKSSVDLQMRDSGGREQPDRGLHHLSLGSHLALGPGGQQFPVWRIGLQKWGGAIEHAQ